jgi:hypothetical protein
MNRRTIRAVCVAGASLALAGASPDERPRVFPNAQGFGVRTQAGRSGRIIRVTNLNPDGPGSLREALQAKGARIVVFEVGGAIDLQLKDLVVTEPFLTVAGQTAPAPGITLIRGGLRLRTHDIWLSHVRVRPGDGGQRAGWEPEVGISGVDAHSVVVDHCSFSWSIGANFSVAGPAHNVTVRHCILSEGLRDPARRRPASGGAMVWDGATNVAFIGNLFAHNEEHNPHFRANTTGIVANNVIYNPGRAAVQLDWPSSEWQGKPSPSNPRVAVVGNILFHGADTVDGMALLSRKGDAYLADNLAFDRSGTPATLTAGLINFLSERPIWPRGFVATPSGKVLETVLLHAGARPRDRDEIDKRIATQVRERRGRIIASQDDVGGYPKPVTTRRRIIPPADDLDDWLGKLAAELE